MQNYHTNYYVLTYCCLGIEFNYRGRCNGKLPFHVKLECNMFTCVANMLYFFRILMCDVIHLSIAYFQFTAFILVLFMSMQLKLEFTCCKRSSSAVEHRSLFRFRFRCIYLVILQTQETSAKTKIGRCRRGHLEKNKVYSIHVCKNNSNY